MQLISKEHCKKKFKCPLNKKPYERGYSLLMADYFGKYRIVLSYDAYKKFKEQELF